MSLLDEFIAGREEVFATFGVSAVLTRVTKGTVDPRTGRPSGGSSTPLNVEVVEDERKQIVENGAEQIINIVKCRDELQQGDKIAIGSRTLVVKQASPEVFKGTTLQWVADVEG